MCSLCLYMFIMYDLLLFVVVNVVVDFYIFLFFVYDTFKVVIWQFVFIYFHYFLIWSPYTPNACQPSTVWFDRQQISPMVPEILSSVDASAAKLNDLVQNEVESGIPLSRIIIGLYIDYPPLLLKCLHHYCWNVWAEIIFVNFF